MNRFAAALALLERAGIAAGTEDQLRHGYVSFDGSYCALTLASLHSYIVDLVLARYLDYPEASAAGFDGHTAFMSPDEVRFNLFSCEDDLRVDLDAGAQPWILPDVQ